ncbi:MAG TPA: hypothetical protein VFK70_04705 [Vicinamibacteria bacterium]|nr:hypothetical protein [Vicinamibacteria bacterium]
MTRPTAVLGAAAGLLAAIALYAAADFESAPTFKASELLPPAALKGPHFKVEEAVTLEGLHRRYRITSDYGAFDALGDQLLATRLKEVEALARLADTSEAEVALKAVGGALGGAAKGAAHAVANPAETVAGVPGGVSKMFGRVGRSAKRTAEKGKEAVKDDDDKASPSPGAPSKSAGAAAADATGDVAKSALGVSAGRRRWAKDLGVDPYTSNPVLGAALDKVGQIDAAGRFATKLVPGVGALSMVASVNSLVYSKSPEELLKYNEDHLKAMGASLEQSKALRLNKNIRLGLQTRIVAALDALAGVADRPAFLERAATVTTETGAIYYATSAEMLARFHATSPLARLVPTQAAAVALTKDGRLVHLVPADYVAWTQPVAQAVGVAVQRAKEDFASARPEVWITGGASARTRSELSTRSWKLETGKLGPETPLTKSGQ